MFRYLLLLFLSVLVGTTAEASQDNYVAEIKTLQQIMAEVHPGYGRYNSEEVIIERDQRLLKKAQSGLSELQLYAEISLYLASFRCDHTVAELSDTLKQQKQSRFTPFQFKIIDNRMYVNAGTEPLQRGDEIITINGKTSQAIISALGPYVSRDGYTDHVIPSKLAFSGDLYGSVFEELFAPVVLGLDEYPQSLIIDYRSVADDKVSSITLDTIDFDTWKNLSDRKYRQDFKDAVSYQVMDDIAQLRVDTFVNYRQPVNAMALFENIFRELNKKQVNRLIVDLRRNGGGSDDAQLALLSHLAKQPFQINSAAWYKGAGAVKWQSVLTTWDRTIFQADPNNFPEEQNGHRLPSQLLGGNYQLIKPAENAFRGEVVMLTSINNASASAGALGVLSQQPGIFTVGAPTGGNLGGTTATIIAFHKLAGSGITARVPLIRNQYNIPDAKDGFGAIPDEIVSVSFEDWFAGRDPILERAISWQK